MGALDGVRVIDFGQYIAGPLAAVMLADQGADVVHVDPPGGPRWQDPSEAFFNRSKRRIVLDLKRPEDRAIAVRLVERADVLIENFRHGVMDRLGLGAAAMMERNPALIYTSIPGFASDDPRRDMPAWEGVVSAVTDIYHPVGELAAGPGGERTGDQRPAYTSIPLASNFAGLHAATSTVMALIARDRMGRGQHIEVPLFDAVYELYGVHGQSVDGVYPPQSGSPYGGGRYQCGDGRWVQFSTSNAHFLGYFVRGAGIEDWAEEGLLDVDRLEREPELRQQLRSRFRELFRTRPAAEWEAISNAAGCPMSLVRSAAEWIENEHARSSGAIVPVEDPVLGTTWMPGLHLHMSDSPGEIRPRRAPDADREEILRELDAIPPRGPLPEREPGLRSALEGYRVLDLTQVVAGPCAGRIMAEYGAEVIKINSPFARDVPAEFSTSGRTADPGNQQHEHLNRGKLTLRLDVRRPEGREVFWKLVDQADVVMQNFPKGTAERYGIGYDEAREHRPDLVYFSLSAYGYDGPWGAWRGYEGNAQAATGLMERFGGDGPPQSQPFLLDDYGTGVRAAFGMAVALYHRAQTGRGQHVSTALVETASYHAARHLVAYEGKQWNEPRGPEALGEGPLQRLYRASDAWFFLGAAGDQLEALASVEDLGGIASLEAAALEQALEERFAQQSVATWLERLGAIDVSASALETTRERMADPWAQAHGLVVTQDIEGVGRMTMPGAAPRLSRTPIRIGEPVRLPGADGPMLLERVGMRDALERLVSSRVMRVPEASAV